MRTAARRPGFDGARAEVFGDDGPEGPADACPDDRRPGA
jgi:hypothetical protein